MELWETADLLQVTFPGSELPDGFWLNFFPRLYTSEAEVIYFDNLMPLDRRLAPFVAPNAQGRIMESRGTSVSSFKPAYVKPKHVINPEKTLTRMIGEPISVIGPGTLTLQQRFDAWVAKGIADERDFIARRWDWMACQALCFASITVSGEDYPTQTIDFKRDASLTLLQSGAAAWDQTTSDKLGDLQTMINRQRPLSRAGIRDIIFGTSAWELFEADDDVRDLLINTRRGSETEFNIALSDGSPFQLMGNVSGPGGAGRVNLWVYSNFYEDDTGADVQFLHPDDVIGVGGALGGVKAFGAILDADGLQATPIFPKNWKNQDPSRVYTMSQSAPLMVPTNPNNSFRIRVK